MKLISLVIAAIKQLFRDKEAIFWSVVFPIIFIFIFKLFNFSGAVGANIIVIDQANNEISHSLITTIQNVNGVGINSAFTDSDSAKKALQESEKLDFEYINEEDDNKYSQSARSNVVIVIPTGYGDFAELQNDPTTKFELEIFYNQASEGAASPSGIIASIIDDITSATALQVQGVTNPFVQDRQGVAVNDIAYYDILVPGIIGMGVMQSGIIGVASSIAAMKEKRILKRLSATPLPIWQFIFAQVAAFLILSMIQVTVMIFIANVLLGARIYGSIPLIYVMVFLGNFVFLNIGFIAAALSKTATGAASLSQVFTTPMMFLSGVFFERETLPEVVKTIADLLPLSPLLDALRDISLQSGSLPEQGDKILLIGIWTIITFLLATRLFKFREE